MSFDRAPARFKRIAEFFSSLMSTVSLQPSLELPPVEALLLRSNELGIRPIDFLMGILQPVLYEVGRRWKAGALTPAFEAQFTAYAQLVLDRLVLEQSRRRLPFRGPPSILVTPPSNRHTLGIQMLGFRLREAGIDARVVTDPITPEWLATLARMLDAVRIGVSVMGPDDIVYARRTLEAVRASGAKTEVVLGGQGLAAADPAMLEGLECAKSPDVLEALP